MNVGHMKVKTRDCFFLKRSPTHTQ